ncbi:Pycsar system effector family protein [Streptomyces sp. NPDC059696]|uniref:Pycsar system effector family protein n=1 Tax=Streptomyces sp. NPDC059696 TaxID=3346911 RepID=UPI003699E59A
MTAAPSTPTAALPEARYVAERLLATVREDTGRADVKASVLLSVTLSVPPLVAGVGQRPPDRPSVLWLVLVVAGLLMWLAGSVSLVRAVLPHGGTERVGPGITFFADVVAVHAATGTGGVAEAVGKAGEDVTAWLLTQAVDHSHILVRKYRCIRWGAIWLVPGALSATAGLLLG